MMRAVPFAALIAAASAHAEPAAVWIGDHVNHGRVVIQLPGEAKPTVVQSGVNVSITLPDGSAIATPPKVPRNVSSFAGGSGHARAILAPGAKLKYAVEGKLLILDVADPGRRPRGDKSGTTKWNSAFEDHPPLKAEPPKPIVAAPPVLEPKLTAPQPAVVADEVVTAPPPGPAIPAASESPAGPGPLPIRVPAGPAIGAAAFRRGSMGIVVFDDRVEPVIDGDDLKRGVKLRRTQGATMLSIPLDDGAALSLGRDRDAWIVAVGPAKGAAVIPSGGASALNVGFDKPSRSLAVSDPQTGQALLLGTVLEPGGAHARIDELRTAPGYTLLPTWVGMAVESTSDALDLTVSQNGFTLRCPDPGTPGATTASASASKFGLPDGASAMLMRQLDAQIAGAALLPPRGRGAQRLAAARTMLSLGLAPEAQALLALAASDDPAIAADPQAAALAGIAAVLAGRPKEADGLDNPNLPATGDIALWRGLRDAAEGKPAPLLAKSWPLLAAYPDAVRARIAPAVMEAAIHAGSAIPAAELAGAGLAFARALQSERTGDTASALQGFDAIATARDERDSVRATIAATELRQSRGSLTAAAAAAKLDLQSTRWRGDTIELEARLKAAEFRTLAGEWRPALESLRETDKFFPDAQSRTAGLKTLVFTSLLAAKDDRLKPLDLVAIATDFADAIPDGRYGEQLASLLADKLAALDLPSRAIPVLQDLMSRVDGAAKTEFALRLARLQLDAAQPREATETLEKLSPSTLDSDRAAQRAMVLARARAAEGDGQGAASLLATIDTPESGQLRATLLAKSGDWQGSLRALESLTDKLPARSELTEQQQDVVLRAATAAVQANDPEALRRLQRFDSQIKTPRADLFRILTANAVSGPEDLPRAARELAMSRNLPSKLDGLR